MDNRPEAHGGTGNRQSGWAQAEAHRLMAAWKRRFFLTLLDSVLHLPGIQIDFKKWLS